MAADARPQRIPAEVRVRRPLEVGIEAAATTALVVAICTTEFGHCLTAQVWTTGQDIIVVVNVDGQRAWTCQGSATTGTTRTDAATPAPDAGFYYLVQARNACGTGGWGASRSHTSCP